ncbi:MAG: hypothetical protein R3Y39_05280 [Rikenellaceae bacterium]
MTRELISLLAATIMVGCAESDNIEITPPTEQSPDTEVPESDTDEEDETITPEVEEEEEQTTTPFEDDIDISTESASGEGF